ncbi:tyrosine-type recombinase/integrase [Thiocapsa marina]|uniref:Integrase family protein n=1 Tax=Thiocapsa marina 5811 TaxID=768671 RepID=F9UA86_9GAMM|nr:site-specific integrase [Thiocapsa marina]EGV19034.1 integrase family protein [Thiocapsa marina 5811]
MGNLSARTAATAKPGRHSDGEGLILAVSKTGSRSWYLRYQLNGKRRDMALGNMADVSLAAAREKAAAARALVRAGIDPLDHLMMEEKTVPTFTSAAAQYIRSHRHGWKNRKHQRQWCATMKTYARPIIGSKPVDSIGTEDILAVLSPIWTRKTETAKRVQGRMENILDWCAARKYRDASNPARWRGHLDHLLPKPTKVSKVQHHPAMPWPALPSFMMELSSNPSISSSALRFAILTACRTGEVLGAQWSEVDIESAVWTVPADRMKAGREHRVPLTEAALDILRALPRIEGNPYIFPGARAGRPLSNMALLQIMRGMGHGVGGAKSAAVPHGFRSSFRDWCGEVSSYPREVAEAALAHVNGDKTEAAYARGDLFTKRRKLMTDWSSFCTRPPATVIDLSSRQTG